ncbi:tripartite motif-containing protein 35-like [Megalops cyprinoides]|uniref:tripartite motif-containing protein 35-like n=1 Tax=Megalops cyprinoides TaxID=118141 RepID=UPI0018642256|nr:tripartite motif-containing protein 35-like [Megalops cyprinoides]
MAAKISFLDEELCCSVCCDIFKDPVVLKCSHSFCRVCLQQCWKEKSSRECPICRRKASVGDPPVNLALKNIVESYLKQKTESEAADCCRLHGEKLLLFYEDDEEALCVLCETSKKHRNHQLCPVEEAAHDMKWDFKIDLKCIQGKLNRFTEVKQECEKCVFELQTQAQHTERQIKAEFEKLHQFLRDEEKARLAALKEEEEQKSQMMKEEIENISRQVSTLSNKITAIEKAMDAENMLQLQLTPACHYRAQCTLQDPELLSGALIDVAKHLGNLKFRVWEKMLGMVQYTPVILEPNTANPWLSLSDDLTSVRDTNIAQQLPDNPERFNFSGCVLGSEGFTSGKHTWEVEVGNEPRWDVGVAKESMNRKREIACCPQRGFWVIRKLQRIRVQLDYDRGEVSFYDPSDMSHIYTFKDTFTERLFPFFCPCNTTYLSNPGVLQICPVKVSVTLMP